MTFLLGKSIPPRLILHYPAGTEMFMHPADAELFACSAGTEMFMHLVDAELFACPAGTENSLKFPMNVVG